MPTVDDLKALLYLAEPIFRHAPDAMIVVDTAGQIRVVNDQALILTGYAEDELLHQPVEVLVPAEHRNEHRGYRGGYMQTPHTRPMGAGTVLELLRKDGRRIPVEINLSVTPTPYGPMAITALRRQAGAE